MVNNCPSSNSWIISPNPANSEINITNSNANLHIKQIKIINASGKIIKIIQPSVSVINEPIKIDTHNLPLATYTCTIIYTNGKQDSKEFVVVR